MEVIELELLAGEVEEKMRETILNQLSGCQQSDTISFIDFLVRQHVVT